MHNTISQLALTLPGTKNIIPSPVDNTDVKITDLAGFISSLLNILFYIAAFLAFYFLIWGAFSYIVAQGKKEELAKAKARITWALIGLIVVFLSYSIAKFASEIFTPKGGLPF